MPPRAQQSICDAPLDTNGSRGYSSGVLRFSIQTPVVAIALLAAGTAAVASGATSEGAPCARTSVYDPLAELMEREQCVPGVRDREPVLPKIYPRPWAPSRRRGVERIATTLYNVHSREALPVFAGKPVPQAVQNHVFRCRGFGTSIPLDPRLVETVLAAAEHFEARRVNIISAYRSPKFNDALAKKGRHVASESKHTRGEAMDFGIPGVGAAKIGAWLWDNFDGGVGTYRSDGFVHIDVGPKRRWSGK